jgi:hypothetical protein
MHPMHSPIELRAQQPFDRSYRRAKNGELLTKKDQVLSRWKEHFEQHLNDGAGHDRPPDQVDLGDDGVEIDLPSREIPEIPEEQQGSRVGLNFGRAAEKRWTKLGECLARANPAGLDQRDSTGKLTHGKNQEYHPWM